MGQALERATLVRDGQLEPQHQWVAEVAHKAERRRKVVILGAGWVSCLCVRWLDRRH